IHPANPCINALHDATVFRVRREGTQINDFGIAGRYGDTADGRETRRSTDLTNSSRRRLPGAACICRGEYAAGQCAACGAGDVYSLWIGRMNSYRAKGTVTLLAPPAGEFFS